MRMCSPNDAIISLAFGLDHPLPFAIDIIYVAASSTNQPIARQHQQRVHLVGATVEQVVASATEDQVIAGKAAQLIALKGTDHRVAALSPLIRGTACQQYRRRGDHSLDRENQFSGR